MRKSKKSKGDKKLTVTEVEQTLDIEYLQRLHYHGLSGEQKPPKPKHHGCILHDKVKQKQDALPTMVLYSDAKAKKKRFAVCDKDGKPVWYASLAKDYVFLQGEHQASSELAAANKALWFAKQVKESLQLPRLKLILYVDAEWLTWANAAVNGSKKAGGKARVLYYTAVDYGIDLEVKWIPGERNPADYYTVMDYSYKSWQDNNFAELVIGLDKII